MNQRKYMIDLLKETRKIGSRPLSTHIEANHKLGIKDESALDEKGKSIYQHLVEKFIYLTLTRSNITYVVNVIGQFICARIDAHIQAIECILCFLKRNPRKELLFMRSGRVNIEDYSDADWGGSVTFMR